MTRPRGVLFGTAKCVAVLGLLFILAILAVVNFGRPRLMWVLIPVNAILPKLGFSKVTVYHDFAPELVQKEAMKLRSADGSWIQVAAIESYNKEGMGSNNPSVPDVPWNRNVVSFIGNHRFAVADGMHPIRVFSADDGKLLTTFGQPEKDGGYFRHFVTSADGRFLTLMPDSNPEIWETATGKLTGRLPTYNDEYADATFLPDGHSLVTYRGLMSRGVVPQNLQVWDIDPASGKIVIRKGLDADGDARGLATIGPYVLLKGYRRSQIFDATTLDVVLKQSGGTDENFLYIEPPSANRVGVYVALQFSEQGPAAGWTGQPFVFRRLSLQNGKELRRWKCPIEQTDERYGALYTVSPKHTAMAISQEGRVNFFKVDDGSKIGSLTAENKCDHAGIVFIDEDHVFVTQQRWSKSIQFFEISSGHVLAEIPEGDDSPIVSPDGNHLIARREWVRDPWGADSGVLFSVPGEPIVLWNRGGH